MTVLIKMGLIKRQYFLLSLRSAILFIRFPLPRHTLFYGQSVTASTFYPFHELEVISHKTFDKSLETQ